MAIVNTIEYATTMYTCRELIKTINELYILTTLYELANT